MRVVVDTNIFVSAALKEKSLPALAIHMVAQSGVLLKSAATESQLVEVLGRAYLAPLLAPAARAWFETLITAAKLIEITERIAACRDPTDDKFLELAVNGRASLIISGDKDLLVLSPFRGIPIITPSTFIEGISRQQR